MQKIRTRHFRITLRTVLCLGAAFLGWFLLFGRRIAVDHFNQIADCVFAMMVLAVGSFLAFCFLPYFRGDRRWFAIPALLTCFFFMGAVLLWQVPLPGAVAV